MTQTSQTQAQTHNDFSLMERCYFSASRGRVLRMDLLTRGQAFVLGVCSTSLAPGTNAAKWLDAAASVIWRESVANDDWTMVGHDLFRAMKQHEISDSHDTPEQPAGQLSLW